MAQLEEVCPSQKRTRFSINRSLPAWLRYSVVILLVLGVFFRGFDLDGKVFWLDEARTSLRMSGHTKTEFIQEVYTGEVIGMDTLQLYQRPSSDADWSDTFRALIGHAEHTPLYFLLARLWTEIWGYSVTSLRSLSALFSLLIFPGIFWLCQELFAEQDIAQTRLIRTPRSSAVGWIALGLAAISPLHVLYGQEARPYSLWTAIAVFSSAVLLWAIRGSRSPEASHRKGLTSRWLIYGLTVALGLYTQILFGLVGLAHGLYVAMAERAIVKNQSGQWRWSAIARSYLLATGGGIVLFLPWLVLLLSNLEQVNEATTAVNRSFPLNYLLNQWFLNINRVFINGELHSFNLLLVALTIAALYFLWRQTPKRTWFFLVSLIAVPFLALMVPDVLMGGERSLRIRYLIPSYVGIQIAMAYLFTSQAIWAKTWQQKFWRITLVLLILGGIMACTVNTQTQVGWSKSIRKSGYYPVAADWINRSDRPLVISDYAEVDILSFSYELKPEVKFQLIKNPRRLKIAEGYSAVFLLNPSKKLRNHLKKSQYELLLLCQDEDENPGNPQERLWLVRS